MEVRCSQCDTGVEVSDDAGGTAVCPQCGHEILVFQPSADSGFDESDGFPDFTAAAGPADDDDQERTAIIPPPQSEPPGDETPFGAGEADAEADTVRIKPPEAGHAADLEPPADPGGNETTERIDPNDVRRVVAATPDEVPPPKSRGWGRLILASYASAVTVALIYVTWLYFNRQPHPLESLPDIQPLSEDAFQIVPQTSQLPPGHSLSLGDSGARFGNVRVRPLRVTRGPVRFEYFAPDNSPPPRPPTPDVLKLWIELRNVSDDQQFAPLDLRLLSRDFLRPDDFRRFANTFVCPADELDQEPVFVLSHSAADPWNMVDQELGRRLKPGESCVVFIPCEPDGVERLQGDLVWRVQIRKGFHPSTRNGVTTLIDVLFHSDQIEAES